MITAKGNISLNKILTHVCPSKKNVNEKNFHLPFLDSKLKENYSPFRAIITAKNEMFNMISELGVIYNSYGDISSAKSLHTPMTTVLDRLELAP